MDMPLDNTSGPFKRIAKKTIYICGDMKRKTQRKIAYIHNVDAVIALIAQIEVLTKKLGNITQNISMVHYPAPFCKE